MTSLYASMPNLCIDLSRWSCNTSTGSLFLTRTWKIVSKEGLNGETALLKPSSTLSVSAFNDYPQIPFTLHWRHKINIGNVWGSGAGYIMGLAGRCHPGDLALGLSKASHAGFLAQEQGDGAGNKLSILFWANGIACVVGECSEGETAGDFGGAGVGLFWWSWMRHGCDQHLSL